MYQAWLAARPVEEVVEVVEEVIVHEEEWGISLVDVSTGIAYKKLCLS